MKYDYLIVGSGLYGSIFAHEAKSKGKSVLVVDKRPNIAGNVYTEKQEGINVHMYGATYSTPMTRGSGTTSHSLLSSTVSQTALWQTTRVSFTLCHLTCTPSTRCGVW